MKNKPSSFDDLGELLTAKEVAEMLKMTRQNIYQRVHRGQIPHIRIYGSLYFQKSRILQDMEVHEPETAAA